MKRRLFWIVPLLTLVLVTAAYYWNGEARAVAPQLMVAPVTRGSIVAKVSATGTLDPVDTVQVGTGSTTGNLARLGAFDGKRDLGYFAELTVPGLVDLVKQGVITSRHLNLHPGKFVTATAGNSADDLAFIADNPMFGVLTPETVRRQAAAPAAPLLLPGGMEAQLFMVPGKVPLYLESEDLETASESAANVGVELRGGSARIVYIPGAAGVTTSMRERIARADVVLVREVPS